MLTPLYYRGNARGHEIAGRYFVGTKAERAKIRRRLALIEGSGSDFVEGFRNAFCERCEQRGQAIRDGVAKRTIRPSKLFALVNR